MTDYYCNQKFYWLTVEPERRSVASCCAATPHKVDLTWLRKNPAELFNTPELVAEREQMLANTPVASCADTCWRAESQGLPSRRTVMHGAVRLPGVDVKVSPTLLHINLGSDCNLTCSYCCKQYSTAWLRDINARGAYLDDARYRINTNDRVTLELGQTVIKMSQAYQELLTSALKFDSVVDVEISGGEPFLYNGLPDVVKQLSVPAKIYTGLGVDTQRLTKILDQLPAHTRFTVSAENVGALYEFNRYGNSWDNFRRNLDVIAKRFSYNFCSVISNLTVHGYQEFEAVYGSEHNEINFCTDPDYLGANVLNAETKQLLIETNYKYHDQQIKETVNGVCTPQQHVKLKTYLSEFVRRRNLSLDVFPEQFCKWLTQQEELEA